MPTPIQFLYKSSVALALLALTAAAAFSQPQPSNGDEPGAQVLTRGPVHEAFAGLVTFNPEPGVVVSKAPPEPIEEMPPDARPEGEDVTWIPGYWAWDDERNDFLWVSGTWRDLPPGREWIAGYWAQTPQGYQWTSGYWSDSRHQETTYLPPPPASVEAGPNIQAPSEEYGWSPGYWAWTQDRYAWSPGYWQKYRPDWVWIPAQYVWTPRGHIFIGGYWDHPVEHRGVIFAPVYFEPAYYARHDYYYSPRIVISLSVFSGDLFLRPRYHHYYFGDYYGDHYDHGGFYASFSFGSHYRGYDPIYSHHRWEHRGDREWEHHASNSYQDRRDHESSRPPRTWAEQRNISRDVSDSKQNRGQIAVPMDELFKRKDNPTRFQPVTREEKQKLAQRGKEVQTSRDQRRTLETSADKAAPRQDGTISPTRTTRPKSPIVAKPVDQPGRKQPPPVVQPSQTKAGTSGRPPQASRKDSQSEPRKNDPGLKPKTERGNKMPSNDSGQQKVTAPPNHQGQQSVTSPPNNPNQHKVKTPPNNPGQQKVTAPPSHQGQQSVTSPPNNPDQHKVKTPPNGQSQPDVTAPSKEPVQQENTTPRKKQVQPPSAEKVRQEPQTYHRKPSAQPQREMQRPAPPQQNERRVETRAPEQSKPRSVQPTRQSSEHSQKNDKQAEKDDHRGGR
jgi:hypothetical protein